MRRLWFFPHYATRSLFFAFRPPDTISSALLQYLCDILSCKSTVPVGFDGAHYDNFCEVGFGSASATTSPLTIADNAFSGWKTATMAFTATSASEMLSFLARGIAPGAPPFMLLDNVALNAEVPEPATWTLLIGG